METQQEARVERTSAPTNAANERASPRGAQVPLHAELQLAFVHLDSKEQGGWQASTYLCLPTEILQLEQGFCPPASS